MLLDWIKRSKLQFGLGVVAFMLVIAVPSLSVRGASSIAQGFQTDDPGVVAGALVSLKGGSANSVELSTPQNLDRLLGVAGEDSLIELSSGSGTVHVVTSGEAVLLVSDINGGIQAGDKITSSPIAGVGMKATNSTLVIGSAKSDLSGVPTKTRSVTNKKGDRQEVKIGAIPIQVDKVFYEALQDQNSYVPPMLQDFADSLAGRPVSPIRIVIASILVMMVFTVVVVLLYSAVRSSIISIGRNPLSGNAVRNSLFQVGLTVFGVLAFAVIVVYLILTT